MERPGFGASNLILAGKWVLALADDGQLVLVEVNPKAYTEIDRAKVVGGKC